MEHSASIHHRGRNLPSFFTNIQRSFDTADPSGMPGACHIMNQINVTLLATSSSVVRAFNRCRKVMASIPTLVTYRTFHNPYHFTELKICILVYLPSHIFQYYHLALKPCTITKYSMTKYSYKSYRL